MDQLMCASLFRHPLLVQVTYPIHAVLYRRHRRGVGTCLYSRDYKLFANSRFSNEGRYQRYQFNTAFLVLVLHENNCTTKYTVYAAVAVAVQMYLSVKAVPGHPDFLILSKLKMLCYTISHVPLTELVPYSSTMLQYCNTYY